MRKLTLVTLTTFVAACASPQNVSRVEPPAHDSPSASHQTPPSVGEALLIAQRQGYTLVNKNGETYYCRDEKKTGSRLAHSTVCLTQKDRDSLRQQTQRSLGELTRLP